MPTIADAKQAVEQGSLQQARLMYEAILQENDRSEEAWLGLADVLSDREQQQECYQKVLRINPHNQLAKEVLRDFEQSVPNWVSMLRGDDLNTPSSAVSARTTLTAKKKSKKSKKLKKQSKQATSSKLSILIAVLGVSFFVLIISLGLIVYILM
ncbi:hypothetical protein QUF58_13310 [Anaerolineales bacterium HSG24]|nr:hypothetical protein [Anaerolineales bacterium HSG24]